jgi:polysaccharide biosynthesis transport protein
LARIREASHSKCSYVVGISSARTREGKSTIAFNLAVVAAEGRERVLLVDADFHRPGLTHELAISSNASLLDILQSQQRFPELASKSEFGFDIVGEHEQATLHPASVLGSAAMAEFLTSARNHYDLIICDLPDISSHADPIVMAGSLDAVVLVAEWGTSATTLARAARQSNAMSARIAGVLINKVPGGANDFA